MNDAGWDGSHRGEMQLGIVPRATHYDITDAAPVLAMVVSEFLALT